MSTLTITLVPQGIFKINLQTEKFVQEPPGNTLTVQQVIDENIAQNPPLAIPDVTLGDFLRDMASERNVNITNIPNNHN